MGSPRTAELQVSRPVLFRPFTSVITEDTSTKTPSFEFVIPRDGDEFIRIDQAVWPSKRFVYVFLGEAALPEVESFALDLTIGPDVGKNPLLFVIQVDPDGKQQVCSGLLFKSAIGRGDPPPFIELDKFEFMAIEPEALRDKASDTYAIAAPIVLPRSAIDTLEQERPALIPALGTGMGIGITGDTSASASEPDWVFPVVDPIIIAEHLIRKFYEACDDFLATSQVFERPKPRDDAEKSAREEGERLRLKKTIADNLIALQKAAPSLDSTFRSNLEGGFPDSFLNDYNATLDRLRLAREISAFVLIAWLEDDLFALVDSFWERNGGKPNPDYEIYVKTVMEGLLRLPEADRGIAYLMDVQNRVEQGSSPVPNGILHVTTEFIFRDTQSTDEQRVVAEKLSIQVFGTWAAFVAAVLAVKQIVIRGPNPQTDLVQDLRTFVGRLQFVFHDNLLTVQVAEAEVEIFVERGAKRTIAPMIAPELTGVQAGLAKATVPTAHAARLLAVLNFGIAYTALRKALKDGNDPNATNMAISDLSGAAFGILDQGTQLPAIARLRDRFSGKINMGGSLLGNRVSSALGLLGAVASLVSASIATADSFDKGDWDSALAHITEGVGAVLIGAGSTVILVSGATGPFALWTIGIGTAISAAGFIWSIFAADTELDQMLKFCAFGTQTSGAKPPGWSLCKTNFSEWDKNTQAGLLLQLKAFQQVFYSFSAAGATRVGAGPLASDGTLRITPSSLRANCAFIIDYTAAYNVFGSKNIVRNVKGRITVLVATTADPKFVDAANNYQNTGAIRVHKDEGKDAMDVTLRLRADLATLNNQPLELFSLKCDLQLQVPNANASDATAPLIIPTTNAGAKTLVVDAVVAGRVATEPVQTVKVT